MTKSVGVVARRGWIPAFAGMTIGCVFGICVDAAMSEAVRGLPQAGSVQTSTMSLTLDLDGFQPSPG
jgi:hypothetical protein